ncbi:MAG: hypothetical protein K8R35_01385, partial [Bacteroidales bacterium]|nr:hypothetical protein [Bacteroidales bacterium]
MNKILTLLTFLSFITTSYSQCPDPSNIAADSIGSSILIISWTTGGASEWQFEYGPMGFILSNGLKINTQNNPILIQGLEPDTPYDFYVRDTCSGTVSNWVGPLTVSTIPLFTPINSNLPGINWYNFKGTYDLGDYDN